VLHVVGERLEFTHDRIREVAYAELLPPTRRMLHATVGRVLEEAFTGRHGEVADQLAGHFSRAEEADRAVRYLALAAERAAAAYAHADAAATLEEAWRSVPRLVAADQPRWLVDLAVRRSLALTFLGRFAEARDLLWPLREHVRRLGDTALAAAYWFRLAMTASYLGDQAEAAQSGRAALDAAAACGDELLRGRAHYVLGVASHYRGRPHDAVEHSGRAIACLDRTGDHPWRGLARLTLALGHLALGAFDAALDALAEMEAIGQAIGEPRLRSFSAAYAGAVLATRGDTAAAVEACRRGLAHAADPVTAALAESRSGQAWLEHGDASRAIPVLARALDAMERFRYRAVEVMCVLMLAEAHLLAGDTAAARRLAARGMAIAREDDYRFWVPYGERVLGRLAWAEGALGEADGRLREAVAGFTAVPAPFEEGRTHLALAELAHARGDRAGRDVHLGSAQARFEALGARVYLGRVAALASLEPGRPSPP
jgi:tetratricopeptide (TPR) repeat protein